jgi:hypothetical protein
METLDIRRIVHQHLRDNLRVSVSTDTEIDYYDEYPVITISLSLIDPETGEWTEIDSCTEVISLPR